MNTQNIICRVCRVLRRLSRFWGQRFGWVFLVLVVFFFFILFFFPVKVRGRLKSADSST